METAGAYPVTTSAVAARPEIELRRARREELATFVEMEQDEATADMILPWSLQRHRQAFDRPDIVYLAIHAVDRLAGFFILALDADGASVEFRRIVVADKNAGTGQRAIGLMENYCRDQLGRRRIWLDVFEHNRRGQHVYRKLGYRETGSGEIDGKKLLYFAKSIAAG